MRERTFQVQENFILRPYCRGPDLVASIWRWILSQGCRSQNVICRRQVFDHLPERTHTFELAVGRRKAELIGWHCINRGYDQFLGNFQQALERPLFALCVEYRAILSIPSLREEVDCSEPDRN